MRRLVVGISGGSGIPIAVELLRQFQKVEDIETHLVYTRGAEITAAQETEKLFSGYNLTCDIVQMGKDYTLCVYGGKMVCGRDCQKERMYRCMFLWNPCG